MMINIISILVLTGFITLLERKVLSFSQMRLGPNKIWVAGLLQPIIDGLKLFKKFLIKNMKMNFMLFYLINFLMLLFSFMLWLTLPFKLWLNKSLVFLWFISLLSLSGFFILMLGWFSFSKFSLLGSMRSVNQILSLEILLVIILLVPFFVYSKMTMSSMGMMSSINLLYLVIFFILSIMEVQRSPMDLSEGESELVSGYNTEFSSVSFTVIFLSEYMNLTVMSMIFLFFLSMFTTILWLMMLLMILIVRSCFPRIRYDFLMEFSWVKFLPNLIWVSMIMVNLKLL